jgi:hypothetical protein
MRKFALLAVIVLIFPSCETAQKKGVQVSKDTSECSEKIIITKETPGKTYIEGSWHWGDAIWYARCKCHAKRNWIEVDWNNQIVTFYCAEVYNGELNHKLKVGFSMTLRVGDRKVMEKVHWCGEIPKGESSPFKRYSMKHVTTKYRNWSEDIDCIEFNRIMQKN